MNHHLRSVSHASFPAPSRAHWIISHGVVSRRVGICFLKWTRKTLRSACSVIEPHPSLGVYGGSKVCSLKKHSSVEQRQSELIETHKVYVCACKRCVWACAYIHACLHVHMWKPRVRCCSCLSSGSLIGWLQLVACPASPVFPSSCLCMQHLAFYVDSSGDWTRVLMLTQQIIFYQLSHLPSPRKSFHTYNGSTLIQICFMYNIRRKTAQDPESDALRLQGNPSLFASEALHSSRVSSQGWSTFHDIFKCVRTGSWGIPASFDFWGTISCSPYVGPPHVVSWEMAFPCLVMSLSCRTTKEEWWLTKPYSTDLDLHLLKELRIWTSLKSTQTNSNPSAARTRCWVPCRHQRDFLLLVHS